MARMTALALLLLTSVPVVAADSEGWRVTPYLWLAGLDGDGSAEGREFDIDAGDVLKALDYGFLVHWEYERNDHLYVGNLDYLVLGPDADLPFGQELETEFRAVVLESGYTRRFDLDAGWWGLHAGVRYWDLEVDLEFSGVIPDVERSDDWLDGFGGIRLQQRLGADWLLDAQANLGAGGSDSTWEVRLAFARVFGNGNRLVLGYRAVAIDYDDAFAADLTFNGFAIGYTFD